jgi:hypothetical protein
MVYGINTVVNNNKPYGCFRNILKVEKPVIIIIIIIIIIITNQAL